MGVLAGAVLGFGLAVGGCSAPSLLITPVSIKPKLVETVLRRDSLFARDKIALIEVEGIMMNAPKAQLLGKGEHPVSYLLEQLDKARRDRAVKAVILRINSPGGSVVASELMYEDLQHFKKSGKPVIAVMMDVAASGGYYIACACDEIVAQPSTVTGSIGVIMQTWEVSETMRMIGVKADAIISGDHKDAGSPLRPMRPRERELFQNIVDDMYARFVKVVADGRPDLDEAAVRSIADGRVYTASQALELGLIDRIAGLRPTIDAVKRRIGATSVRLVTYHRVLGYKPNVRASMPGPGDGDVNLFNVDLTGWPLTPTARFMYLWAPGY